jgi:hypothetical protein
VERDHLTDEIVVARKEADALRQGVEHLRRGRSHAVEADVRHQLVDGR